MPRAKLNLENMDRSDRYDPDDLISKTDKAEYEVASKSMKSVSDAIEHTKGLGNVSEACKEALASHFDETANRLNNIRR